MENEQEVKSDLHDVNFSIVVKDGEVKILNDPNMGEVMQCIISIIEQHQPLRRAFIHHFKKIIKSERTWTRFSKRKKK